MQGLPDIRSKLTDPVPEQLHDEINNDAGMCRTYIDGRKFLTCPAAICTILTLQLSLKIVRFKTSIDIWHS